VYCIFTKVPVEEWLVFYR